jgi:hypothetical protein
MKLYENFVIIVSSLMVLNDADIKVLLNGFWCNAHIYDRFLLA